MDPPSKDSIVPTLKCPSCRGSPTFGRSASKTEWVYGFKVALVVDPKGVVSAFGLAPAATDERPIGETLIAPDRHETYLADKGFAGIEWERRWLEDYGALVAATPKETTAGLGRRPIGDGHRASARL